MAPTPTPTPPEILGLTLVRHLGGGGFADVYLYEQKALGRRVAVKVLRANASTEDVQRQFTAESRLMAALSDHINIVTIHDASIAPDGRPYLVMAYCPGLNLADRYKTQQMTVAEVLSIGVQLAGAIETAHRQGILHRDIKPANVLTAADGRPALTDFGISVAMGALHEEESVGLSIPWSPPEMLSGTPTGDHRADVYSLAASLFTLLARRSPFELLGRSNDQVDLITRIQRAPSPRPGGPMYRKVSRWCWPPGWPRIPAAGIRAHSTSPGPCNGSKPRSAGPSPRSTSRRRTRWRPGPRSPPRMTVGLVSGRW